MQDYIVSLHGARPCKMGTEMGTLGPNRLKLFEFLDRTPFYYTPQKMITKFLSLDALWEERAVLLGRIGRHEPALEIYAQRIGDQKMAEEYCRKHYDREKEGARDVYLILLILYLKPTEAGVKANMDSALYILEKYYDRIDTSKALDLLPNTVKVARVHAFITAVITEKCRRRREGQVLMNLLKAERLQVSQELLHIKARRSVIDDERLCFICRKPLRNSAFARYPNDIVMHLGCCNNPAICPCSNPTCQLTHEPNSGH